MTDEDPCWLRCGVQTFDEAYQGRRAFASGVSNAVVVYRSQDRLFFANAHFFERRLWAAVLVLGE